MMVFKTRALVWALGLSIAAAGLIGWANWPAASSIASESSDTVAEKPRALIEGVSEAQLQSNSAPPILESPTRILSQNGEAPQSLPMPPPDAPLVEILTELEARASRG